MSSRPFRDGWRIVRSRRRDFVDPARVRRRTAVSGLIATLVGAFLVVSSSAWNFLEGSWWQVGIAEILFAASLGCLSGAFWRVSRDVPTPPTKPLGDWRRSERIGRQFAARAPEMLPEGRDEVIARADRSLGPSVVAAERYRWIPTGWVLAWFSVLVSGLASTDSLSLLLIPPVFALLQSGTLIAVVMGAGRADAARNRALALPATVPLEQPAPRQRDQRGSRLDLPES